MVLNSAPLLNATSACRQPSTLYRYAERGRGWGSSRGAYGLWGTSAGRATALTLTLSRRTGGGNQRRQPPQSIAARKTHATAAPPCPAAGRHYRVRPMSVWW